MDEILSVSKCFEWLLRSSWQGAVLVMAVLLAQTVLRRRLGARWRFNLWWLVLARLLLPFSPESALSVFNFIKPQPVVEWAQTVPAVLAARSVPAPEPGNVPSSATPDKSAQAAPDTTPGAAHREVSAAEIAPVPIPVRSLSAMEIASLIWLAGVAAFALHIAWLAVRTRRRLRDAVPVGDAAILRLLDDCRRQMKVRAPLRLMETANIQSPALCGMVRTSLLLPPGFTNAFSPRELRHIFLHELAHYKRRDIALNWLVTMLQIAHWFNPCVWFGFARLRADRELACDALAMDAAGEAEAREYGRTVIKLLETLSRPSALPGLVGIMEDKHQMERRIRMIAAFKKTRWWSIPALVILAVLAATGLTDAVKPGSAGKKIPPMILTVLDAETGAPIEGARIISGYTTGIMYAQTPPTIATDKNGTAKLPREGFLKAIKGLGIQAPEHAPKAVTWTWGYPSAKKPPEFPDVPEQYTIKLERGTAFGGVVRDEAGHPVPNARVEIKASSQPRKENVEDPTPIEYPFFDTALGECPVTDAEGRWQCAHFPEKTEYAEISLVRPDNSCARYHTEESAGFANSGGKLVRMADLTKGTANMVFPKGIDVRGVVLDPSGQPLMGITLTEIDNRKHSQPLATLVTGSDGQFTLPNRDPHQILIKASGPGWAIHPAIVEIRAGMPEVRIVMNRQVPLRLRVVDKSGRPVAKASLGVFGLPLGLSGTADAQGRLVCNEAPREALTYAITSEKSGSAMRKIKPGDEEPTVVLRHQTGGVCMVTVKAETPEKQPVPSFTVSAVKADGSTTLIGTGTDGLFSDSVDYQKLNSPKTLLKIEASGFTTFVTDRILGYSEVEATAVLKKVRSGASVILLPDGTPAAKATLVMSTDTERQYFNLSINSRGVIEDRSARLRVLRADDAGRYALPKGINEQPVIIVHKDGFLETSVAQLQESPEARLQPWGRIEGVLTENGKPKPDQRLELLFPDRPGYYLMLYFDPSGRTDQNGRFTFAKVPPGDCELACTAPSKGTWPRYHLSPLKVTAGETTTFDYARTGRTVTGRLLAVPPEADVEWQKAVTNNRLVLKRPERIRTDPPAYSDYVRIQDYHAAFERWGKSLANSADVDAFGLQIEADGSFQVDAVPPGTYELEVSITDPERPVDGHWQNLGSVKKTVVVPPAAGGSETVDLGAIEIAVKPSAKPRQPAKPLTAKTPDGQRFDLASQRGKGVLIVFWAPWAPPSQEETQALKEAAETFGSDPRFTMAGVAVEDNADAIRQCAEVQGIGWINTHLQGRDKVVATETWGIQNLPTLFLVGPDGNLFARDLKPAKLKAAIGNLLQSIK